MIPTLATLSGLSPTEAIKAILNGLISSIGYNTGVGGAVVQATSKATAVTLNTICGQITTHAAALNAATTVNFSVVNSMVGANDVIIPSIASGGTAGAYTVTVSQVSAGAFSLAIRNESAGTLSEALVINFAVIKAVAA